jgi:hypothetical protein
VQGLQGTQGIQGEKGDCCDQMDGCCCDAYANVYASISQIVTAYNTAGDTVLFDKQNVVSATEFDLSAMGTSGEIKFLTHGYYHVAWQLQARITSPVPFPVPSWSIGFFLNGALVNGSIYSGYTQSPNDDAAHSTGDVIIEVKAGDLLKLRNTCISNISLNPFVTGSVFPITIASINIECLKKLA